MKGFVYDGGALPSAHDMRLSTSVTHTFAQAGWHCSCCFPTLAMIRNKLGSYGHDDITRDPALYTKEHIVRVVRAGSDLYDRADQVYNLIEPADVPKYVTANAVRFSYLLDRRGPTAGFTDFLD